MLLALTASTKFTPEVQDKITLHFLKADTRGLYDRWKAGENVDEKLGDELSRIWRGLPHSSGGTYPDQYAGRNKAHMSRPDMMRRMKEIKRLQEGGIVGKAKNIAMASLPKPGAPVSPAVGVGRSMLSSGGMGSSTAFGSNVGGPGSTAALTPVPDVPCPSS